MMSLTQSEISSFRKIVNEFYSSHKRKLPWRETDNPYEILVSEIMLQQTQVSRVLPKYEAWLQHFPSLQVLANAEVKAVLNQWQGLGYNRRALNLHKLAKAIVTTYGESIPLDTKTLTSLPGIGSYTAGAVYVFSTNKPAVFIETNIRTVYIHHFFKDKNKIRDKEITTLIETTLDKVNPKEWYYALMDYGAHIKKTVGNLNHKSTTYSKQSKFEGSRRQLRGRIIRELSHKEYLTLSEIHHFNDRYIGTIDTILKELQEEGFIVRERDKVYLIKY